MTRKPKGLQVSADFALPLDVAVESLAILGTKGSGKSSTAAVLCEELWDAAVQFVVLDPTGVFWGLRSSADGQGDGIPVVILGGPHSDAPLEPTAGALIADVLVDSGQSLVLDLSDFPSKAAQTRFATDLAERLYRRKARARTPLHIVLDEAEEFIPQDVRGDGARMVGAWETIVALGRSRGLGETLISRRVQAVNKKVLDLIETLVAMRTGAPLARKRVEEWIEAKEVEDDAGVVRTLKELPTGTAWVWSPLRGALVEVPIRRIRTFDSYATPKPGEAPREARTLAAIDVAALGAQIAATVEQAKENDPAELRRRARAAEDRAAGLEQQVEKWKAVAEEAAATAEPVTVEVPVLSEATVAALSSVVGRGEALADSLSEEAAAVRRSLSDVAEILGKAQNGRVGGAVKERKATTGAGAAAPAVPPTRHDPPPPPPPREPRAADGTRVSGPQQKILDALAWFEGIRVPRPRRSPLGAVAGSSPKSSGFEKNLSTLRTAGLIDYPEGGRVCLTDAGRALATYPETMPTLRDLHEAVFRMVSGPQAQILRELIAAYPTPLSREEIARRAGVSAASSGFEKNLSTLRSFELVDYPDRGWVAALPVLFPGDE